MFNKTRIFITLTCPRSDYSFESEALRGCFYLDIEKILPFQKDQSIAFGRLFYTQVESVLWLTDLAAQGIYTKITEIEKEKIDKCEEYLVKECKFIKI